MKRIIGACTIAFIAGACVVWAQRESPPDPRTLPFSPARQAGGTLYLSGQIAIAPDGTQVRDSVGAETRQAMKNLEAQLVAHGYTWSDVVNVTVYLASMDDYAEMNEAYRAFFDGTFPARACIGGVELAFGFRTEISAIAHQDRFTPAQ